MLSVVVICALGLYLYLASKIFYEDKTLLIYELNQTNVRTFGGEVEMNLKSILDQMRIWAQQGNPQIEDDSSWIRVGWIERGPQGQLQTKSVKTWPKTLEFFGKNETFLDQIRTAFPIPFDQVIHSGTWVRNVTMAPKAEGEQVVPMMTIAMAVQRGPQTPDAVIFADVKLDPILGMFSHMGIAKTYLVDSEGYPLATPDQKELVNPNRLDSDPLIFAASQSKVRSEVRKFEQGKSSYLGSFYRLEVPGMVVASKVELQEAYSAAAVLVRKSALYALMVVTAAFLIALIFSYTLTSPIQRLVEATRQIAQGNFNLAVPVSSRDELAVLATSFNTMTRDLRSSREQLEEYSRDLEKKVADRTLAMREAQDALIRTTRLASVGEVAGRAAHEVLNPLTNISTRLEKIRNQGTTQEGQDLALFGQIIEAWEKELKAAGASGEAFWKSLSGPSQAFAGKTLLEEDVENLAAIRRDLSARREELRASVEFLLKESDRISKIVNGMRQLTRVGATRKLLGVHAIVDETLAAMNDLFHKNGIQIGKGYCEGTPQILVDHDEFLQVISNLFRNSLQAIQEARRNSAPLGDPARIWITTQVVPSERGPLLRLRIYDNGPGIPQANANLVFEPTFTTKSTEEGTGLGLSICRRFIRAWDGEITLEKSTPGVETAFLVELPEGERV
jgi:signal transduction histidine kinase